jgi:signal transduction histidine kinase/CheY-like chemotaxis protein
MNDPSRPIVDERAAALDPLERRVRELEEEAGRHRLLLAREQARRLEALGALAGGVAHDFNNLLTSVLGNTDLALAHLPPSSPVRAHLKHIEHAARRAADLTRQMLACSGRGQFLVRPLALNDLLRGKTPWLRAACPPHVRLEQVMADDLPPIDGDSEQLAQVLMHVVSNACEAIGPHPGTVRMVTGVSDCMREDLASTYLDEQLPEGRYVFLDVSDTGAGMTEDIVSRMFEPFFTTRFTGRGLGLAATLGILRGHRGAVRVRTELDRGTTMRLLFPVRAEHEAIGAGGEAGGAGGGAGGSVRPAPPQSPADEATSGASPSAAPAIPRGVLVIDDEETVRGVARMILERAGFRVVTAATGAEGIARFRESSSDLGIVLLDLKLRTMSSRAVSEELGRIQPGVRIVLSSGYPEEEALSAFEPRLFAGFLAKPYRFDELIECVQRVVAEGRV